MSDDGNTPTTRLLTLLNVSAGKSLKRKQTFDAQPPSRKLNTRSTSSTTAASAVGLQEIVTKIPLTRESEKDLPEEDNAGEESGSEGGHDSAEDAEDPYDRHFGAKPVHLTTAARDTVDNRRWNSSTSSYRKLGSLFVSLPFESSLEPSKDSLSGILQRWRTPFLERRTTLPVDVRELQDDILSALSSYRDLYHTQTTFDKAQCTREVVSLHALNHVSKKRRRVLKNNERLSHAIKNKSILPEDVQDQGFTRPAVLILMPFRSSALKWLDALMSHMLPPTFQIENLSRFRKEFGLPEGTIDKLATADAGTYPLDHVEMFKGNIDDSFRVGIKATKKSLRLFSEFYGSDVILASPLGLRISIEKEKNFDFLSSIEIMVIDQTDALTMQNWQHVQFVMSHLNQLPKESHNTDFSRIKPWYLDGHAAYLRQSIVLTAYETPETRHLYNHLLKNVTGKARTIRRCAPVQVPEGLELNFVSFDCSSAKDEPEKRFTYFTTQMLPAILKSAVQSSNTAIFIPSSLDFIRVQNHFRKQELSFAVLSEYSSNQDISRARQAFFNGKKAFLLISERFHFYRRYRIRGIRNLVFYGPPDHAIFYTELLSFPFLDQEVEPSDVTCRVLFSQYDWFRMERIAGTKEASQLIRQTAV
ncbi:digestive organ expansion factor [Artomyces pyxidatus]|uniref:Digestive organ expansion factor n=1 Tax=Artomyces pyxidatus TaxID=48021 RepID=A0ACB8TD77_9AGAM|nr:digestive organ expansion factor [Artomyces pyxidatus]